MNILATIKREQRKLEKRVAELQGQLDGLKAAATALGNSASNELGKAQLVSVPMTLRVHSLAE